MESGSQHWEKSELLVLLAQPEQGCLREEPEVQ